MKFSNAKKRLINKIMSQGSSHPKKHGQWFRLKVYDSHVLILDSWNGQIYHHIGGEPHDTDNLYRVVYKFRGAAGVVKNDMINFWSAHIKN